MMNCELNIKNLKKVYGDKTVIDIPELTMHAGELIGLVGNNGAGKTTLMRLMLSNGMKVNENEAWKHYTGSFIDGRFLIDFYTPEEYFTFIGNVYGLPKETIDERLACYAPLMHDEILGTKKYIRDFSEGNRQKIGILGAMIINPEVLILDEPFNYLDPSSQIQIAKTIHQVNKEMGTTVVLSSHNLNFVSDISSRILLLERGLLIKDLPNEEGSAMTELKAYFGAE